MQISDRFLADTEEDAGVLNPSYLFDKRRTADCHVQPTGTTNSTADRVNIYTSVVCRVAS